MRKLIFLISFVGAVLYSEAQQDTVKPMHVQFSKKFFLSGFSDVKSTALSPLHWDERKVFEVFTVATLAGIAFDQDQQIARFSQSNKTEALNTLSKRMIEPFGHYYSMGTLGILYTYGVLAKDPRAIQTSLLASKSAFYSLCLVNLVKYSFHRSRPYESKNFNSSLFDGPAIKTSHVSFYSGHTTFAFSIATVIAEEYHDKPLIPILAYTISTLVGLSRIYDNKHWASDVVLAAAVGYGIGRLVSNKANWGYNLTPPRKKKGIAQLRSSIY